MLDHLLEGRDLTVAHMILTMIGFLLAIYVMQLTSHEHEDEDDPAWLQWGRRFALTGVAGSFLWSLSYSLAKQWQPWPPEIALHLALILMLLFRALAIHARIKREGARPGSERARAEQARIAARKIPG